MAESKLHGSGGYVVADLTDEQAKRADLGVGKLFLAPIGKLEAGRMLRYRCNSCEREFPDPPEIRPEKDEGGGGAGEEVADNLTLVERGQYACHSCGAVIGEYRVFQKHDETSDTGLAKPGS